MVLDTDRDDLRVGQYVSYRKFVSGDTLGTRCYPTLLGLTTIPQVSMDALATIAMERVSEGLARCNILGLTDELVDPIQRIMLGLPVKLGTYYKQFISERKIK